MDGLLVVYDKEKEDAPFNPEEHGLADANGTNGHESSEHMNGAGHGTKMHIHKSVYSKNQKANPVAAWKLSNHRINAFAFSPDNRHLAVVSEDGTLRILDYLKEEYVYSRLKPETHLLTCCQGYLTFSTHTMAAFPV